MKNPNRIWRQTLRQQLLAQRTSLKSYHTQLLEKLQYGFPILDGWTIGFCWPYQEEVDVRPLVSSWSSIRFAVAALQKPGEILSFRHWTLETPMINGAYQIPIPHPDFAEIVSPDILLIPMIGFDQKGYRLGYGKGYFDRFLGQHFLKPICIGLGFESSAQETIKPHIFDVPMDFIVTEKNCYVVTASELRIFSEEEWKPLLSVLAKLRGLPHLK